MTGDKVDAVDRQTSLAPIHIATATEPGCKLSQRSLIAFHKLADNIPVFTVPFGPAITGKLPT